MKSFTISSPGIVPEGANECQAIARTGFAPFAPFAPALWRGICCAAYRPTLRKAFPSLSGPILLDSPSRNPSARRMPIKSDKWIRRMSEQHGMIDPFEAGQVRDG